MTCEYCGNLVPDERRDEFKLIEKMEDARFMIELCSQGCLERYLEESSNNVRHKVVEGGTEVR